MGERTDRTQEYRPDKEAENLLEEINDTLTPVEETIVSSTQGEKSKLLFICYAPRTGSTLLSQMMAQTNQFTYVSNFTARFWKAPNTGFFLEKQIGLDKTDLVSDTSRHGRTPYARDPHEFGFFWRRFFPSNNSTDHTALEDFSNEKKETLQKTINTMRIRSNKPIFFKSELPAINSHIISSLFPDAHFIVHTRKPLFTVQSIIRAREKVRGSKDKWWSVKPKKTASIRKEAQNIYEEIGYQVKHTYKDIYNGIDDAKITKTSYEGLCRSPQAVITSIFQDIGIDKHVSLDADLQNRNHPKLPSKEFEKLDKTLKEMDFSHLG